MAVSTIGPNFAYPHQHFVYLHISYKVIENIVLNVTLLTIVFITHPVYYRINAQCAFYFCGH